MSSNTIYTHKHHIIPRHLRGTCPLLDLIIKDKSNLIELTVPEHAEAHRVLYEEFGNVYDKIAWKAISGRIGKEEIIRLVSSENGKKSRGYKHTEEHKKKMSLARKGKKLTEEHKKKMSLAQKGKEFTVEHKKNMSLAHKGKKFTEETKRKISLAGLNRPKVPCPQCGKLIVPWNMTRHLHKKVPCMS